MARGHLEQEWLERWLGGATGSPGPLESVLAHLGEHCETCRLEVEAALAARDRAHRPYGETVRGILVGLGDRERELDRLRAEARKDFDELCHLSAGERCRRIRNAQRRFRSPFLVDLLLEESRRQVTVDPTRACQMAQCAQEVALRLPREPFGEHWIATCVARAHAWRGNALRACGDFRRAEPILEFALDLFEREGSGDPLIWAELKTLLASLSKDLRRFPAAERHLEAALTICQRHGVRSQLGRLLVKKGELYRDMGEPEKGIAAIEEALPYIDLETEPRLYLCAQHNLAHYLHDAGHLEQARQLLVTHRELYDRFPEPWTQLRRLWLEGKIACRLGELEAAEQAFVAVRQGFAEEGMGVDAALASLDLALVWIALGKTRELARLAPEVALILRGQGVEREAMAALLLFEEAALREAATVQMIQTLLHTLRPERQRPYELPS